MKEQEEKKLLLYVKYGLPLFVLLISICTFFIIQHEYHENILQDKTDISQEFINNRKLTIKENVNTISRYIDKKRAESKKELEKQLRSKVNTAHNIALNIYNKNKDTKSKAQITQQIKDALQAIRFYEGRGYFFIYDMNATNIFHPTKPQREGKNYFYDKDVTGVYRNQIALHIIKTKGEGFFSWFFNKPNNTTKEYEKYGFVKKFAPYNWFIGTGEYLENYENNLKQQILEHVSKIRYKNNEFAAIIDFDGNVLYHASKKVLHANIFKEKRFAHLKKFYQNLLLSKSLDGYDTHTISVQSQKVPNETKTIYSQKYKDWGWFLSRGFRSSEVTPIIKQKQQTLEKQYNEYKKQIILYTIVVVFILLIITFTLTNKLSAKLYDYTTKLSQQKETLLYAQKVAHIGDWSLNVDTQKARWSKSVRDIVGIKDENQEFGPDYLQSIMHPDDVEGFTTSMNDCITLNKEHHCTYRIYRPNGQIRWIECRGVFDAEKNTVFGVIQDITERKELELERHRQDEIIISQSRLAAMGEMISMIAHQWRQPLAIIAMNSNNVLADIALDSFDKTSAEENAYSTLEQTDHLSKTIDDFRNFFKPDKKKDKESIVSVCNESIHFMQKILDKNNITYTLSYEDDKNIMIYKRELLQVFINIIKNAIDALADKSELPKTLDIKITYEEDFTQIAICNNGKPINPSHLSKIFEPYFSTKNDFNGTGLGLYMSKTIIEKHMQGKIFAQNIENGVCFIIQIPLSFESEAT